MVNDPVADLITRLKNASVRGNPSVEIPWTKVGEAISLVLKEKGYVNEIKSQKEGPAKKLVVKLNFREDGSPAITGVKRVSKPGVRRYVKFGKIPRVFSGLGTVVLSTSSGVVSADKAIKNHLGGEILFEIW